MTDLGLTLFGPDRPSLVRAVAGIVTAREGLDPGLHPGVTAGRAARRAGAVAMVVALLAMGCARSEAELKAEFDAFVATHNECAATEECVLASADCPLGCSAAVNVKHETAVEKKAAELVDEYERWGRHCDNDCVGGKAMCIEGRCAFVVD
jgi:hypothetical protein